MLLNVIGCSAVPLAFSLDPRKTRRDPKGVATTSTPGSMVSSTFRARSSCRFSTLSRYQSYPTVTLLSRRYLEGETFSPTTYVSVRSASTLSGMRQRPGSTSVVPTAQSPKPFPLASMSALSPIPSLSVSNHSVGSSGNTSPLSPTPSPSVSVVSVGSIGNASLASATPSLSSSPSWLLPSPSKSESTYSPRLSGNWSKASATPSPSVSRSR